MTRVLQKLSFDGLQSAFAEFVNGIVADSSLAAAVDGKVAKQMKDENGHPILVLNAFAQTVKGRLVGSRRQKKACRSIPVAFGLNGP